MSNPFVPPKGEKSEKLPLDEARELHIFVCSNGDKKYAQNVVGDDIPEGVRSEVRNGHIRRIASYVPDTETQVFSQAESRGGPKRIER